MELISPILNIAFLIIIGAIALLLALCVYIYIRYGRTPSVTITSSILVVVFFIIAAVAAFVTLQNFISYYA